MKIVLLLRLSALDLRMKNLTTLGVIAAGFHSKNLKILQRISPPAFGDFSHLPF
jgi:hypothetical protein